MNWLSRKKIFITCLIIVLIHFFSKFYFNELLCGGYSSFCSDLGKLIMIYSFIFVSIFIFSLITYKLKDKTFNSWKNFTVWFIPLSFIFISFIPTDTHGMDFVPIVKGTVIIALTILYSTISLILIIYKSLKKDNV